MKKLAILLLLLFPLSCFAIKFPTCNIICKEGQACGDICISKKDVCEIPLDWGSACDYRYIKAFDANKARCCFGKGGAYGCAGDRIICNDGTLSDKCACKFLLEQDLEEELDEMYDRDTLKAVDP